MPNPFGTDGWYGKSASVHRKSQHQFQSYPIADTEPKLAGTCQLLAATVLLLTMVLRLYGAAHENRDVPTGTRPGALV